MKNDIIFTIPNSKVDKFNPAVEARIFNVGIHLLYQFLTKKYPTTALYPIKDIQRRRIGFVDVTWGLNIIPPMPSRTPIVAFIHYSTADIEDIRKAAMDDIATLFDGVGITRYEVLECDSYSIFKEEPYSNLKNYFFGVLKVDDMLLDEIDYIIGITSPVQLTVVK